MTLYLLDENVLREMGANGDANVRKWLAGIDDDQLRLSVMTLFEKRLGCEAQVARGGDKAKSGKAGLELIKALEEDYKSRIIPISAAVAAEWSRLLGPKQKNQRDMALAATARVHDLVLVTRNVKDFVGHDVQVLNPFKSPAVIVRV